MEKRATFLMFNNNNHIVFDIQHLSVEDKRKEIMKYNPLHYIFGYKLEFKPWLPYLERNEDV